MPRNIEQLPEFDINAAFASHADFDKLVMAAHERGPLARSARGLEVLGYEECVGLLRDKRLESDHMALVNAMEFPAGPAREFKENMLLSHGRDEYRTKIRQALMRAIGPGAVEAQRSMIRRLAKDILQEVDPNRAADLLQGYGFLLPARLFCMWFGAPLEDAPWVAGLSERVLKIFSFNPSDTPDIIAAYDELFPYVQQRIDAAVAAPQDNLIGHFVKERQNGQLTETELFYIVAMFNEASTDNTAHGVATAIGELMGDEQRWQQVVDDPALIPAAINESMRLSNRINSLPRYASEDLVYQDVAIPKGTPVFHVLRAAHRDPRAYEAPLNYDPHRDSAKGVLDFGGGVYTCLGKHVALIEIQEAVAELASSFPRARVCEFSIDTNMFVNAVSRLQIQLNG